MGFPGCYWLVGGLGHCHGVIPADILLVDFFAVFLHQFHQLVVGVTGDFSPQGQFTTLANLDRL